MSADVPLAAAWTLTLPCTREEAEAIALAELDLPPGSSSVVLMTSEVDEAAGEWRLDAFFEGEPAPATVAAVRALAASGGWSSVVPEPVVDQDWVALSQRGLEPIREGRFVVHTDAHPAEAPANGRAFLINAGQAFGTGHHHTTAGCLAMLDALAARPVARAVERVIDLGTGTGLLAFAARHLWPDAVVVASDIDPVAIEVTRVNMAANGIEGVELVVADGAGDRAIQAHAPYDLVVANILAGPLVALAPEIAAIASPGAAIVLAGLLTRQADEVVAAYHAQGCALAGREERGDWTILCLRAGAGQSAVAGQSVGDGPPGDRDGWARDA